MKKMHITATAMVPIVISLSGCVSTQSSMNSSCQNTPCDVSRVKDRTTELTEHLTGSFSSLEQSLQDPEFYEIILNMVPIWEDRTDGPWLYVEQAVASTPEQPYRQRVYQLARSGENEYLSTVYSFENPLEFAGDYSEEYPLNTLTPDDLVIRQGCAISVAWDADQQAFIGSTNGRDCQSSLRGSTYATSEVFLHLDRLITWDRGFDDAGEQVWGAVKGGYIFDRIH